MGRGPPGERASSWAVCGWGTHVLRTTKYMCRVCIKSWASQVPCGGERPALGRTLYSLLTQAQATNASPSSPSPTQCRPISCLTKPRAAARPFHSSSLCSPPPCYSLPTILIVSSHPPASQSTRSLGTCDLIRNDECYQVAKKNQQPTNIHNIWWGTLGDRGNEHEDKSGMCFECPWFSRIAKVRLTFPW